MLSSIEINGTHMQLNLRPTMISSSGKAPFEDQHYLFIDPSLLDLRSSPEPPANAVLAQEEQPQFQDHQLPPPPSHAPFPQQQPSSSFFSNPNSFTDIPFDDFIDFQDAPEPPGAQLPALGGPPYLCDFCPQTFPQRHQVNTHMKKHTLDFKCDVAGCTSDGFRYRKDRDRHIREKHPEASDSQLFFCPEQTCKHSRERGKGFARKDNYRRHVKKAHPGLSC
ncbi:uncharacterized protein PAC_16162 [Phialocephala subalpina]|uniref:C2H2-type domain-containing protein n=1 Tax=Phialocephala subalpina TaxID=576137 RepID=A0A1L7XMI2_9HELO|nr:uncharacterized protein PAC_16162 [Phialocephala subalpina]